jgi:hypothetical protein
VPVTTKKKKAKPDAYEINMKSLIIEVYFDGVRWLITGDATGLTLAHANEIFADSGELQDCFMVTVPHHGAEPTVMDLKKATYEGLDEEELAPQNLTQFVLNVNGQTVTASAAQAVHRHPAMNVIEYFWVSLSDTIWYQDPQLPAGHHFYNAYIKKNAYKLKKTPGEEAWPTKKATWHTVETKANVFSSIYFVANQQSRVLIPPNPATPTTGWDPPTKGKASPPPHGVQWGFGWDGTTKTVERRTNREVMLARVPGAPAFIWPSHLQPPDALFERSVVDRPDMYAALAAARVPAQVLFSTRPPIRQSAPPLHGLRQVH